MMRTLYALVIVAAGSLGALVLHADDDANKSSPTTSVTQTLEEPSITADKPMSFWMAKKLDHSKSLLEALTKGDFERLAADAQQMRLLGKLEGFVRRKNEDYRGQLNSFDLANQELIRQAKRRNAEGAALAFNQLTSSCVSCHVMLREEP